MDTKELRGMSVGSLQDILKENKDELVNLRFQKALQQLDNPVRIRVIRRDIARIKTIISEKQQEGSGVKG